MIHIKANNGDFFLEESQIISVSNIDCTETNYAIIDGIMYRPCELVVDSTYGEVIIKDTISRLEAYRNTIIKATVALWQSN